MNKFNLVVKRVKGQEYLITDMIATKLSKAKFEKLKELNKNLLGEYVFIKYEDTDFSWWDKVTKYLTERRITKAYFDIDFYGNVTKLDY